MGEPFSLILDIVLAVLLVVMIWYSVILNKRLNRFRGNREQMERLAATFNEATTRATSSIGDLRIASDALQDQLARAESLRDDLVFLVDRGTLAADRLEQNVRTARDEIGGPGVETADPLEAVAPIRSRAAGKSPIKAQPRPAPRVAASGDLMDDRPAPRSEAERALLKAIRQAN